MRPDAPGPATPETGFVRLYSGVDGAILAMLEADSEGDQMGRAMARLGDTNGDGLADFAIGAPFDDVRTRVHGFDLPQFPWSILGGGLAGQRGIPRLRGEGVLDAGRPVRLTIGDGRADAPAALHLGRDTEYTPFHGGYLVPAGSAPIQGLLTGPDGTLSETLPWPPNLPIGVSMYFQVWLEAPAGPEGFSASNAVRATPR